MHKKQNSVLTKIHPLSSLVEKLSLISAYPLNVLEAPSGFGKTTAVREYFRANKTEKQRLIWQTLGEENRLSEWEVFCHAIANIDTKAGAELEKLSIPYDDRAIFKLHNLLNRMDCDEDTFIVLDNHQFARERIPLKYVEDLCHSLPPNVHFVVITQKNAPAVAHLVSNGAVNHIGEKYLTFTPDDILEYYATCNLIITDEQAQSIYKSTGGWIAAIYLNLLTFAEQGNFDNANDTMQLVETAVWKKIDVSEQSFLLRLCFFDSFDVDVARFINGSGEMEDRMLNTLKNTGFVYYDTAKNCYFVHSILHRYVKSIFNLQSRDFRTDVTRLTARWHERNQQNFIALHYYNEIEDYDSIFKLNLATSDFTANASAENKNLLLSLLDRCPESVLMRYPRALPVFAFALFIYNEKERLTALCDKIQKILSKDKNITRRDKNVLSGELLFITAFLSHNDFAKMGKGYLRARQLIGGTTSIINKNGPWTFGSPSILYMFYRYEAESDTACLEKNIEHYLDITNGHGTGADSVMRSELMFNQGDFVAAEITAHQAAYKANNENQLSIYLCAVFLLAQISVAKGDKDCLKTHIKVLKERAEEGKAAVYHSIVSLGHGFLGAATGDIDAIPNWLKNGDTESRVRFMSLPYANIVYSKALLLRGEYEKLIGIGELLRQQATTYPNALAQIYLAIHLAAAYEALKDRKNAEEVLKTAISIALPDRVYMPFAQNYPTIQPILKRMTDIDADNRLRIKKLHDIWAKGVELVAPKDAARLSKREREVVILAAEGATNKEIGKKLFLSASTVKNLLARVFKKTGLTSRSALGNYIKTIGRL